MPTHASMLALVAAAGVAASALMPGSAAAFGRGRATAAPVHVTTSTPSPQGSRHYGYGNGRGWCYWHPYRCNYRTF